MSAARRITGKTVLLGMLAFFAVIFLVNSVFVYFALVSWPGLSTENAYKKGINYNETLAAAKAQSKLGWRSAVSLTPKSDARHAIKVRMSTPSGDAVSGLKIQIGLERPTHEGHDQEVSLKETSAGIYEGEVVFGLKGQWRGHVVASTSSGHTYTMRHELTVR